MHKPAKRGSITIAFDDAYLDTYKNAIKYLDALKIKSTVAVPTSYMGKVFEKRKVLGPKGLKNLIKSGHEIASHTCSHLNLRRLSLKDKEAVISEISESKKELEELLGCKIDSFVFPYINKNQTISLRSETRHYYKSARITSNSPCFNKIPLKNAYAISGFSITKNLSVSYLNKQADLARKNNLWLVEVFHLVGKKNTPSAHRPKPYRFFMHIDDFKKHIDYLLSKNMPILTQKEAVKILR